ncbi:MAG: type I-B CRISPR-associated protein Cas8b1/Cst1 [Caldimicrobium sp.]|nr:type I-B CRISPR-associated protein Cas8b1/Cst1 [Caldimicrobium sp.]
MERVYLGDWLYNASIVGFLKINKDFWEIREGDFVSKDENILRFGDNYIEFDREIFRGFCKRHFDYAFNQYGRYNKTLETLKNLELTTKEENLKENFNILKEILTIKKLQELYGEIPRESRTNLESFRQTLKEILRIMEEKRDILWENDAKIYLSKIYGQKSFLQRTVNKDIYKRCYTDFEHKLLSGSNETEKIYRCVMCSRKAKKGTSFDTGLSTFYGLNEDAKNFLYNFRGKHSLCEICEIIYFCYFAGFTRLSTAGETVFFFVNSDTTVKELLRENLLLERVLNLEKRDLADFFTELIVNAEEMKAIYSLQNIQIVELKLSSIPKIHTLNLSKEKAELIKNSDLGKFSKLYYYVNDQKTSLVYEIIHMLLENRLSYSYLYFLIKVTAKEIKTNIRSYHIQQLTILITNFLKKVGGLEMNLEEREMWSMYYKGKDLAHSFKSAGAENKISAIAYKLLNALRVGEVNQFMNILFRTYMAVGKEIPSGFVKTLHDKNNFYSLGYSFLNGFMSEEKEE